MPARTSAWSSKSKISNGRDVFMSLTLLPIQEKYPVLEQKPIRHLSGLFEREMTGVAAQMSLSSPIGHRPRQLEMIARRLQDGSLMLRQMPARTIRHLPRQTRTCAGCFLRKASTMLATSILSTWSDLEHCNGPSRTSSRGAAMNSISESRAKRQRHARNCAFRHRSDWQESRETSLRHCQFCLWSIDEIALHAGSIHDRAREGDCRQRSNGSANHSLSTLRKQSCRHV